ncbi:hypothetical protein D8911_08245 [Levilactobacillus brevis]|nr:hypothetical protein D8911_08245 [Levilactobacillus brevis]
MEPAVSTVLAEVLSLPTAWDDLGDWRPLPGFQAKWKPASQAGAVPHSRWNPWQPQASGKASSPFSRNGRRQLTIIPKPERKMPTTNDW